MTRTFLGTVTRVSTKDPVVALTFDDGPHPEFTPSLLKILEKHGAKATFFMIGENAKKFPETVKQVASAGHAIGNHSWDHQPFIDMSRKERRVQILKCQQAIFPYGHRIFRPPRGIQDISTRLDLFFFGYQVIAWDVSAEDYKGETSDVVLARLLDSIHPGSIVVLHDSLWREYFDGSGDRSTTINVVDTLLEKLKNVYEFVTLPVLFQRGKPDKVDWYKSLKEIPTAKTDHNVGALDVSGESTRNAQ